MSTIPSKQLHREDTLENLGRFLSNREIGLCKDTGVVYIKDGQGVLIPVHGVEMSDDDVQDILDLLG